MIINTAPSVPTGIVPRTETFKSTESSYDTTRPTNSPDSDPSRLAGSIRSDEAGAPGLTQVRISLDVARREDNPRGVPGRVCIDTNRTPDQRERGFVELVMSYEVPEGKLLDEVARLMDFAGGAE